MQVAVIGGGAAGFFCAINIKENFPEARLVILEKSAKLLSKVKISGGGRCNITNGLEDSRLLHQNYPRGSRLLKKAFYTFDNHDAMKWFRSRGVPLVIQDDQCVFPKAQDSQVVIDCFLRESKKHKIIIKTDSRVKRILSQMSKLLVEFDNGHTRAYDKIVVCTGGSPQISGLKWLERLGHTIAPPVPSLFTFNMPKEKITKLMGIVTPVTAHIAGTKLQFQGPLLITHWGFSGPAILQLSSFGARVLAERDYKFTVRINWTVDLNDLETKERINNVVAKHGNKLMVNTRLFNLPDRLWRFILSKAGFEQSKKWNELGSKGMNRLSELLCNDLYQVEGKTTFKEEFVTCGGVDLSNINSKTMESKHIPNLYFAGEVLNIDGLTGGFNFQAAWTTAFIAAKLKSP